MQRTTLLFLLFVQIGLCQDSTVSETTTTQPLLPIGPFTLPTFASFTFPTLPPIDINQLLQGIFPTLPPIQLPTFPPIDPNAWLKGLPTLPPFTLGPLPTLNPSFPWLSLEPPCIPKLLSAGKQPGNFSDELNAFATTADIAGAFNAALNEAKNLCTPAQQQKLTDLIAKNQPTWALMTEFGRTLSQDEREKVKSMMLNNDAIGLSLFNMQKSLENIFNPKMSQLLQQISSQVSAIQFQLLFSPI